MCGISSIMYKSNLSKGTDQVGGNLVKMLESMTHRGKDSCGVTIAGQQHEGDFIIRMWAKTPERTESALKKVEETLNKNSAVVLTKQSNGSFIRLTLKYDGEIACLAGSLMETREIVLHSIGETSEVIKDVGTPVMMDQKHNVGHLKGTHGIGHVRMATESKVDISHAHPFWAYPFSDVTVVHNGQLTNYYKLRRMYEDRGLFFQTGNDSELIAVYLANKMAKGQSLDQALSDSLNDLDGTFTYIVSTSTGIGYAKDKWSAKPLVTMETDKIVAIASEEIALRSVFDKEIDRVEPQESEFKTWSL